jgi:hypothetical protein
MKILPVVLAASMAMVGFLSEFARAQIPPQLVRTNYLYMQSIVPTSVTVTSSAAQFADLASDGSGHHYVVPTTGGQICHYRFDNDGTLLESNTFASNAARPSITSRNGLIHVALHNTGSSRIELWESSNAGANWTNAGFQPVLGSLDDIDSFEDFRGVHISYASSTGIYYHLYRPTGWATYASEVYFGSATNAQLAVTTSTLAQGDSAHVLSVYGMRSFKFPSSGNGAWLPSSGPYTSASRNSICIVQSTPDNVNVAQYMFVFSDPSIYPPGFTRRYRKYGPTFPWGGNLNSETGAATGIPSVVISPAYEIPIQWPNFVFSDVANGVNRVVLYRVKPFASDAPSTFGPVTVNQIDQQTYIQGMDAVAGANQGSVVVMWRSLADDKLYFRRKPYPVMGTINENYSLTDTNWVLGTVTVAAGKELRLKNGSVTFVWGQSNAIAVGRLVILPTASLILEGNAKLILEQPTNPAVQGGQIELPNNYSLVIPSTAQLVAKAGSKITFGSGASLVSYGKVTMTGSVNRKVELVGTPPLPSWSGMSLSGSGSNGSRLEYVNISGVTSTGGSALLINNSTNDTVRYCNISNNSGIFTNGVNLVSAGSPDVSFDTLMANGGYGIVFQGTNGNFYGNVVKYNNTAGGRYQGGGVRCITASPQFGRLGFPAYQGNNTIKGISPTDNSNGVAAYTASYPYVGSASNSYYGYNDIDSALQRVYANGSDVMAEQCWWGSSSPDPTWFVSTNGGTIGWQPYLSTDPTTMGPGILASQALDSIRIAMDYRASGNYIEARRIIQSIISAAPTSIDARQAASAALHLYRDTHDGALYEFVREIWTEHWQGDGLFGLIVGKMLIEQRQVAQAVDFLNAIAQSTPGTEIERNALLDIFYLYISQVDRIDEAGSFLRRLEYNFADDPDVWGARSLYSLLRPPLRPAGRSDAHREVVSTARLSSNFPNPFNPSTELRFELPEPATVSLIIYDMLGRRVVELANGNYEAGYHAATWNAADMASGVYLARLNVVNALGGVVYSKTNKLVLMK